MSYAISYAQEARWLPVKTDFGDHKLVFLLEDVGDNNVWSRDNKSRAHDWSCIDVHTDDDAWLQMREVVERSASCCGGGLKFYGSCRYIRPEAYIGRWRKAIADAAPLLQRDAEPVVDGKIYHMNDPKEHKIWRDWHRAQDFRVKLRIDFAVVNGKVVDQREPEASVRKALLDRHGSIPHSRVKWSYGDSVVERWSFDAAKPDDVMVWWALRFPNQPAWRSVEVPWGPDFRKTRRPR